MNRKCYFSLNLTPSSSHPALDWSRPVAVPPRLWIRSAQNAWKGGGCYTSL